MKYVILSVCFISIKYMLIYVYLIKVNNNISSKVSWIFRMPLVFNKLLIT